MPSITDIKRQGYRLHRSASNGAAITLVQGCGEYTALFECATRLAEILGNRALEDQGDGILESIPFFRIASEDLFSTLQKITQKYCVALVEYAMTRQGGGYVCICKLPAALQTPEPTPAPDLPPKGEYSTNLDDY